MAWIDLTTPRFWLCQLNDCLLNTTLCGTISSTWVPAHSAFAMASFAADPEVNISPLTWRIADFTSKCQRTIVSANAVFGRLAKTVDTSGKTACDLSLRCSSREKTQQWSCAS